MIANRYPKVEGPIPKKVYDAAEKVKEAMALEEEAAIARRKADIATGEAEKLVRQSNEDGYNFWVIPEDPTLVKAHMEGDLSWSEDAPTPDELRMGRIFSLGNGVLRFMNPENNLNITIEGHNQGEIEIIPVIKTNPFFYF